MKDKNGVELKTGQVVKVEGAYFKNQNGLYFVEASPGDPHWSGNDYSLRRIKRNGELAKTDSISFWPLCSFVGDKFKRAEAKQWNAEHATIEAQEFSKLEHIEAFYTEEAERMEGTVKRYRWDFGESSNPYKQAVEIQEFYKAVAESLA